MKKEKANELRQRLLDGLKRVRPGDGDVYIALYMALGRYVQGANPEELRAELLNRFIAPAKRSLINRVFLELEKPE